MSRKQKAVGIISLAQILYLETRKEEDKRREGPSTISAPQSATGLPSRAGPDKVLPPDSEEGPVTAAPAAAAKELPFLAAHLPLSSDQSSFQLRMLRSSSGSAPAGT